MNKKNKNNMERGVLLAFCLILLIALIFSICYGIGMKRRTDRISSQLQEERKRYESLSESVYETESLDVPAESELSASESETTQPETTESEAIEAQVTVAESTEAPRPQYIDTLRGVSIGTTYDRTQIDPENLERYFDAQTLDEGGTIYNRINGKSYQKNNNISLEGLRYLKVLHYNFDHQIQVGELIVHKDLVEDYQYIFQELYKAEYEIKSMNLIDNYWTGDADQSDWESIDVNNTSAFCYRSATGGGKLSNHAYGKAIDINPQQNPYVNYSSGKAKYAHDNAASYIARDTGKAHVITHEDLCYKLFAERGFSWGGDWGNPKDYQHFDKK